MNKSAVRLSHLATVLLLALSWPGFLVLANASDSRLKSSYPYARATHGRTALDEYVAAPDLNYAFFLANTIPDKDCTTFVVEMTSQAWLTTNEVDRPLWKHWLIIVKPKEVTSSKSLLFISGGSNGRSPPASADNNFLQMALATKSVVTELK